MCPIGTSIGMIIATAGHVDHGKTALVKALTGIDTDRLPAEKERGLTIELGFAFHKQGEGDAIGFVDVPGHEKFVRNMVAGVAGVDFVLLVIAADDGPMPQTLEHLAIMDNLGLTKGAVVLSKIDSVDAMRLQAVSQEIKALLAGTFLEGAPVFPVSAITDVGVKDLRIALHKAAGGPARDRSGGNFRLAIDRSFIVKGSGLVVTGTAFAGGVSVGDTLTISPSGLTVRVRGLHAQNAPAEGGFAGQRLALNITGPGVEKSSVGRGDWVVAPSLHAPTDRFDAMIRVLPSEARALKHWTSAHVHIGAQDVACHVAVLDSKPIPAGASAPVQIVCDKPMGCLCGDRLILRDQSARRTIAGGEVIDPFSPKRGRAKPARRVFLDGMVNENAATSLEALLNSQPTGLDLRRFALAWNLTDARLATLMDGQQMERVSQGSKLWGISIPHANALRAEQLGILQDFHQTTPHFLGLGEAELAKSLQLKRDPLLIRAALDRLVAEGMLARTGAVFHAPDHQAQPTVADVALWATIVPFLNAGGRRPPRVGELAAMLDQEAVSLLAFLDRAVSHGLLYPVAKNRYYPVAALRELASLAVDAADEAQIITAGAYRTTNGIGRNLTINLLEFFDKIGFTERVGDGHRIVRIVNEVFGS